jgi:ATP-dependent DNA helicase RecQ
MMDQVEHLPTALRSSATIINSLIERDEIERRLDGIAQGRYRLVYAAPARLRQQTFIHALARSLAPDVSAEYPSLAHSVARWARNHDASAPSAGLYWTNMMGLKLL